MRGDFFCFERSDPEGETRRDFEERGYPGTWMGGDLSSSNFFRSQGVNRGSSNLESKVGILIEWPKKTGFEF